LGACAPGGRLCLSGVLVDQEPAVRAAYQRAGAVMGVTHVGTAEKNGWVRIDFVRQA
jgi:ribosomal protein L11 methylase PrmA